MFNKILIFILSLCGFFFATGNAKASTLYLSPGSANIPAGQTVTVSVVVNTGGESINGVSAYLSYPTDKLEVTYASCGGSFGIAAERSYGGGSIRISCGSISGASGSVNVATIGLRGKAQGTATVSFVGGSAAARTSDSADSLNLGGSRGGTFTIGGAKPITAIPTGTSSQKVSPSPALPKDTTKPIVSKVVVSLVSTDSATITWQTDEKADSTIEYGIEKNRYFLVAGSKDLTTTHSVKIKGPLLTPGSLLHFYAKSKDESGNEGISNDSMFRLKGYNVRVRVADTNGNPIKDTEVLLYTMPLRSTTDLNGEAVFIDVTSGKHLIVVKVKNTFDKTQEINVADNIPLQNFTVAIESSSNASLALSIGLLVTILAMVGALLVYWNMRREAGEKTSGNQPS